MSELSSENSFNKGLQAVLRGQYLEALAYFEASMELVQRAGNGQAPVKYLSYYGLCLAMASARLREAREICERAVEAEFYNPDLYLNLGKVYLKGRDRARAFGALIRGLQLNPRHAGIICEISHLGIRKRPVLPFLDRSHPLNRVLGRLRRSAPRDLSVH